jgi:hypothetical protein
MDQAMAIETVCYHCNVSIDETQTVALSPCSHRLCVWCMIERQRDTKDHHNLTCYCGKQADQHSYQRRKTTAAGNHMQESNGQVLETVTSEHKYVQLVDVVDDTQLKMHSLRLLERQERRDIVGENGLLCKAQSLIFLDQNDRVRFKKYSFSTKAAPKGAAKGALKEEATNKRAKLAILKEGTCCPPLSAKCNLHYSIDFRPVPALHTLENLPSNLESFHSDHWTNALLLQTTLKTRGNTNKWKKVEFVFPQCLLLAAITLQDRLNIINWWCTLSMEQMKHHKNQFSEIFRYPTVSAERKPRRAIAAVIAAQAELIAVAPEIVSTPGDDAKETKKRHMVAVAPTRPIIDDKENKKRHIEKTKPGRIHEKITSGEKKYRRMSVNHLPATDGQVIDSISREAIEKSQMHFMTMLQRTAIPEGLDLIASCEAALIIQTKEPKKKDRGGKPNRDNVEKKTYILGRNNDSLESLLSRMTLSNLMDSTDGPVELWHLDSGDVIPATVAKEKKSYKVVADSSNPPSS